MKIDIIDILWLIYAWLAIIIGVPIAILFTCSFIKTILN